MEPRNHYPPLPRGPGSRAFRLLTLEPGGLEDDIVCQLHIVNPDEETTEARWPVYDAVSYSWGERNPKYEILVGAWPVLIRENLFHLLQHLRVVDRPTTLWIDALCIDQSCYEERAAQVQMMDQIYKHSRCVLVWLGLPQSDGLPAMQLVKDVALRGTAMPPEISSSAVEALKTWAYRPYWSRTWVVQEFLLATELVFICGTIRLGWSCMSRFLTLVEWKTHDRFNSGVEHWKAFRESPARGLMRQRDYSSHARDSLLGLLVRNQHTKCQEPCDHVYAVLGLSNAPHSIQVSYTMDRRRLAHDVLRNGQIAPKDLVRYTSFLYDLLQLDRQEGPHSSDRGFCFPNDVKRRDIWELTGFTVGEIISHERLDGPPSVKAAEMLRRIDKSKSPGQIGSSRTEEVESLLHRLHSVAQQVFKTDPDLLEAISDGTLPIKHTDNMPTKHNTWPRLPASKTTAKQNTWPRTSTNETSLKPNPNRTPPSLVAVLTSGCARQEILIGVADGTLRTGDEVVCFLGHPVGLSMSRQGSESGLSKISGRLAFVSRERINVSRDRKTQKLVQAFAIQNESELEWQVERKDLQVTTPELFAFVSKAQIPSCHNRVQSLSSMKDWGTGSLAQANGLTASEEIFSVQRL